MKRSDRTGRQNGGHAVVVPFPDSFENRSRRHLAQIKQIFPLDDQAEAALETLNILAGGTLDDGTPGDAA